MAAKFTLRIEVLLDEEHAAAAIEAAREAYSSGGGASALVDGEEQAIQAEQFITCPEQALMELVEANPGFEKVGIAVDKVSCRRENGPPQQSVGPEEPEIISDDELDEGDSGLYVCRWPNGDFSMVSAETKREAIVALDEWDAADSAMLIPMDTCMIDFRLNNRGEIELAQLGQETAEFVWKNCYPLLDGVLTARVGNRSRRATEEIQKAVKHERTRLQRDYSVGPSAKTEVGRELQRRLGVAGPTADHYVEQFASRLLRSGAGKKGMPS